MLDEYKSILKEDHRLLHDTMDNTIQRSSMLTAPPKTVLSTCHAQALVPDLDSLCKAYGSTELATRVHLGMLSLHDPTCHAHTATFQCCLTMLTIAAAAKHSCDEFCCLCMAQWVCQSWQAWASLDQVYQNSCTCISLWTPSEIRSGSSHGCTCYQAAFKCTSQRALLELATSDCLS